MPPEMFPAMSIDRRSFVVAAGAAALLPGRGAAAVVADDPLRIPIKLTANRVIVDCAIGGQGPLSFVLDTGGAIGLIDMALVKTLKLKLLGFRRLGLSIGTKPYPIYAAPDLEFGGLVRQPTAAFAAVENFNFGDGLVGSLAAGVLSSVEGDLDFDAREWRIYRGSPPDRAGWTRYDKAIEILGNQNGSAFLFADATLGGRAFRFGLDTGMPSTLRIYRKTAEAAGLWQAPRWTPAAPGDARMVKATLDLAGTTLSDVLVTVLENPEYRYFNAGIIGLPILRRFNLATSVSSRAVFLRRNGLPAQPERYNRAGMWIDREGKGVKVSAVGAGSPANLAEIKPGDRLIGADFNALVNRMYQPAGTQIALKVDRGGAQRDVMLTLADFL